MYNQLTEKSCCVQKMMMTYEAQQDAASKAEPGTYETTITATVEKDNRPQPNPLGDYRAEWTPKT